MKTSFTAGREAMERRFGATMVRTRLRLGTQLQRMGLDITTSGAGNCLELVSLAQKMLASRGIETLGMFGSVLAFDAKLGIWDGFFSHHAWLVTRPDFQIIDYTVGTWGDVVKQEAAMHGGTMRFKFVRDPQKMRAGFGVPCEDPNGKPSHEWDRDIDALYIPGHYRHPARLKALGMLQVTMDEVLFTDHAWGCRDVAGLLQQVEDKVTVVP